MGTDVCYVGHIGALNRMEKVGSGDGDSGSSAADTQPTARCGCVVQLTNGKRRSLVRFYRNPCCESCKPTLWNRNPRLESCKSTSSGGNPCFLVSAKLQFPTWRRKAVRESCKPTSSGGNPCARPGLCPKADFAQKTQL